MTSISHKSRIFFVTLAILPLLSLGCGSSQDSQLAADECTREAIIISSPQYEQINREPSAFQCQHTKILANGLQPAWFDANNFKGKVTYNAVYRFVNAKLELLTDLTHDRLLQAIASRPTAGIAHIDSHVKDGKVFYHAIFQLGFIPDKVYYHVSAEEHERLIDQYFKEGLKIQTMTVASVNGKRYYSAIYMKYIDNKQAVRSTHKVNGFQTLFDEQLQAGRQLVYRSAYIHNGESYYVAIFDQISSPYVSKSSLSEADLRAEIAKRADPKESKLLGFAPYEYDNKIFYSATWKK